LGQQATVFAYIWCRLFAADIINIKPCQKNDSFLLVNEHEYTTVIRNQQYFNYNLKFSKLQAEKITSIPTVAVHNHGSTVYLKVLNYMS